MVTVTATAPAVADPGTVTVMELGDCAVTTPATPPNVTEVTGLTNPEPEMNTYSGA